MSESFNQITLEALATLFQILAAISVGIWAFLTVACIVGIAGQLWSGCRKHERIGLERRHLACNERVSAKIYD